tara:strand:+ start:1116 stop:2045 length:930 start_codon:yes stop_codon:yes gene_type:complete
MKKIIFFLILFLFQFNFALASIKLSKGNIYDGKFSWRGTNFKFPEGEWTYFNNYYDSINSIDFICIEFVQTKSNLWKGLFSVCEIVSGGKFAADIGLYLSNLLKKGKYDNCTLRREYYYANLWSKGMSYNCFKTRHVDIYKELNYPDDPETMVGYISNYVFDNNIKLPKIALQSQHIISFASVRDKAIEIVYNVNPELIGGPKTLYEEESKSEYHRSNIYNYPDAEKFMNEWTKKRAKYHRYFENEMKAKKSQKLDLSEFGIDIYEIKNLKNEKKDFNIINEIKELNEMYKSGVLTKEEFEKAKKMLLN